MAKGGTTTNDLMKFYFYNVSMPSYGNVLYVSLHTADPGVSGNQMTYETAYTGYTRVGVSRTSGISGFVVTSGVAVNTSLIQFPLCTANPRAVSHFAVGTTSGTSMAGQILHYGSLSSGITVFVGYAPQFAAGQLSVVEV